MANSTRKSEYDIYEKEYVEQGKTLKQIAVEFGLVYQSLRRNAMIKGWTKKRESFMAKVNKKSTEITEKRIEKEAETLDQKNARRASWWKRIQEAAQALLVQAQYVDANGKKRLNIKAKELSDLSTAYEKACRGERLEDAQPIEIAKVEQEVGRDEFFDAIRDVEERNMELEAELERVRKENEKLKQYDDGKTTGSGSPKRPANDGKKVQT